MNAFARALRDRRSGLVRNRIGDEPLPCWVGRVDGLEDAALPNELAMRESRNNRLAWLALNQDGFIEAAQALCERIGAARVALVLGTSTSSIDQTERAYRELDADGRFPANQRASRVHQMHALGGFVQSVLGTSGPCLTISTACSSSAKVFASAARLLQAGMADAAIVGGADTLCGSVIYGFNSLGLVSTQPCRPFDVARSGLSLGEAAGFAMLEKMPLRTPRAWLAGYGESADAHHMSSPHPQGLGAQMAMDDALDRAGVKAEAVDYINLHGTASVQNDEVEAALIARRFPATTLASSTKGWTGHTLGAAGIVEIAATLLAIERGFVPGTLNAEKLDPACGPQIRIESSERPVRVAMSNSFGFGGNNCSVLLTAQRP